MDNVIETAKLNWQTDDNGMAVPTSSLFGDVYFSKTDGLAESRYVFIDGNNLPDRLANLSPFQRFVIGEIGFGTGLNVLAIWQLWQKVKPNNPNNFSHLHIISTEKFPLTKTDLQQSLSGWTELAPLAEKLIANYPPPLAGCHRLNFFDERITIDIWFGDATASLTQLIGVANVDAWLLDGFAPSCNEELWSDGLFTQIERLSKNGTTLATFSVASPVKTGLKYHGFTLAKRKGFGKKREMLTATFQPTHKKASFAGYHFRYNKKIKPYFVKLPFTARLEAKLRTRKKGKPKDFALPHLASMSKPLSIAVIGAGVAGLSVAYALAVRGHYVTIVDKDRPLAGASGNIRAFLAPKLTSLNRLATNLHAIGYLASCRFYPALNEHMGATTGRAILQTTGCLDLLSHNRLELDEVQDFPPEFACFMTAEQAKAMTSFDVGQAIFLPHAGLIDTASFAKAVLSHSNITFRQATLKKFNQHHQQVITEFNHEFNTEFNHVKQTFDHLIVCMALDTCDFIPKIKRFNHSRGQVTWFAVNDTEHLPKFPLKYGGYFATFAEHGQKNVLLGASFVRDTLDTKPALADHVSNVAEFLDAVPQAKATINIGNINATWQGQASIRSQTVDYLPLVGQVWQDGYEQTSRVWTFSALGSKGYAYAPICSELLAGLVGGELLPLAKNMVKKLNPNRKVLQC